MPSKVRNCQWGPERGELSMFVAPLERAGIDFVNPISTHLGAD